MLAGEVLLIALQITYGDTSNAATEPHIVWVQRPTAGIVDCMRPLARQLMDVSLRADCTLGRRGDLRNCGLRSDSELTARQERAAQCLIREYRFGMSDGSSPEGRAITVPINLRIQN